MLFAIAKQISWARRTMAGFTPMSFAARVDEWPLELPGLSAAVNQLARAVSDAAVAENVAVGRDEEPGG